MMQKELKEIYAEILRLQEQAESYWSQLREEFDYSIKNGKVRFDKTIKKLHRSYRVSSIRYLANANFFHLITAPVIYGMIFPIVFFDLTLTIYQHICFRAYKIPRVARAEYFKLDRHLLSYLNTIEKVNCLYCSYGNGVVAYSREILARTEQFWCPIKHAVKLKGHHDRYQNFSEYGDAENYRDKLIALRGDPSQEGEKK